MIKIDWISGLFFRRARTRSRQQVRQSTIMRTVETLEERQMLTAVSWIATTDGFWDEPANWSTGTVPTSADDVTIDLAGSNPAVTIRDSRNVNSIISRESLTISSGTFQIAATSQIDGSTLTLEAAGALGANGTVTITSTATFDWQGGFLYGSGMSNSGAITISAAADVRLSGTLTNNNTITHSGAGALLFDGSTRLFNNAGAVYDLAGDADFGQSGQGGGFGPSIENAGTLRKSAGTSVSAITQLSLNNTSTAVFDIDTGRFNAASSGTWAGFTSTGATAGIFEISGNYMVTGTMSGTGSGHVELTGSVQSSGADAKLNFPAGYFHFTNGLLFGAGSGFDNQAFITISGSNDVRLAGTMNNHGSIIHTSDHNLLFDGSTRLNNLVGGLYDLQSDADIGRSAFGAGFSPFIQNEGTLRKSDGVGLSTISNLELNHTSTGVMDVKSGVLRTTGTGNWVGATLNADTGAVLEIAGFVRIEGTFTGTGGGQVQVAGGGSFVTTSNGATLNFPAGLLHWTSGHIGTSGALTNIGFLQISGDTDRTVGAVVVNQGTVVHSGSGDTIDVASGGGSRFENQATGVYDFQGDDGNVTFSTFVNAGTIRKTGGTGVSRFIATNGQSDGFISFENQGGTIDVQTGTLRLARGGSTGGGTFNVSTGAVLDVTGNGSASFEGTYSGTGGGRVELPGGNISAGGAGATFDFPAGMFHWSGGGIAGNSGGFRNDGTITIDGANGKGLSGNNFINNGTMINVGPGEFGLGGFHFTNSATGVFEQRGDSPLGGTDQFNNAGRFINNGRFWKSAGSGSVTWNTRWENGATGVVDVDSGRMTFSRGGASTGGTFQISAGAVFELVGNDIFDWAGTFTGTGPGTIEVNSLLRGGEGTTPGTLVFPQGMFRILSGQLLGGLVNDAFVDFASATGLFVRAGITNNGTWTHSGAGDFVLNANSRFINNGLYDLRTDADLVVPEGSGGAMFFVNTPTGLFRKSGGLGTSTLRHDGTGKELRFDNAGTVEVQTGTVEFIDTIVQFSAGTLTGGEWIAREFSTIAAPSATNITTNLGRVTLDGLGSSFARINALATNNGSFTVTGGRDFATVGNLANSGEITVGPGSDLTVTGNLTETSVSRLVGWWRGEDNANDSAGSITGTLSGNTTFDDGEFGHGFGFDGNRDFVSLGNPTALRLQDFTISAWVKRDAATQALIFGYGQSGYGLGMFADGKLFLTNIGISNVQTSNLQVTDNEFHHLAVTKSGGSVTFYIDGVAEVVAPYSTSFNFFTNAAIGGRADAGGSDFDGVIDEVAVFSRPLSTAEIQSLGQTSNPTAIGASPTAINIQIGDRPGTGEFGKLIVTGAATFTGAFNVELVGGFGPVIPDAYTVLTYASHTGLFFPVTGISPSFDIAINPTQTTLTVVASAADLAVQSVTAPTSASPGDLVTINFTVQNLDNINVVGNWFDSIYLSEDGTYDPSDLLIGRVEHIGGLAPLGSYNGQLNALLPGVIDGSYRVIIVTDSRTNIGDSDRSNNQRASSNPIAVDLPVLAFDILTPLTISPNEDIYLRLDVPFGGDVLVTADFLNAQQAEFFVRQGALPTRSVFDFVANDLTDLNRTITVASPLAGPYYILFHGREGATGGIGFNVVAENIEFDLQTVSPGRGSNLGHASTILTGAGFTDDTVVQLLNGLGSPVATATSRVISQNRIYATFDLVGVAAGTYAVRASQPGFSDTFVAAYQVVAGQPGDVRVDIVTPGSVRGGRLYSGYIDYQNIGDTDVVPPLIFVVSSSPVTFDLTRDPSVLEDRFLAISPEGPAGILAPGQSVRIPFRFFGNNMSIEALTMSPDETEAMDWEELRSAIRPDDPPDGWDAIFNAQFVAAGSTVGDYVHLLAEAATLYQTRRGTTTSDPDELHGFLIGEGFADSAAVIRGYIYRDDPNRPAGGVAITAVNRATGEMVGTESTADGLVRIPDLAPGTYDIIFEGVIPPSNLAPVIVPASGLPPEQTWVVSNGGRIKGRVGVPDGVVIENLNADLIPTVTATDEEGTRFTARVNQDRVYEFSGLPAGTYDLAFRSPTTVTVYANDIVVVEGATTGLIDLFSPAGGSVQGRVRDAKTNQPLANIFVVVENDPLNPRSTVTDANGNYLLQGVTPGTATISATFNGISFAQSGAVQVQATQVTQQINLLLAFSELGSIEGTVSNGITLVFEAIISIEKNGVSVMSALTNANGYYEFEDLPPGDYDLVIEATGYGRQVVPVTIGDNEDVVEDITLSEAATLHGTVTVAGSIPPRTLPGIAVRLLGPGGSVHLLETDDAGEFAISDLQLGTYTVMLPDGSHRHDFEVTADTDEIDASFQVIAGVISGRLLDTDGVTALSNASVHLVAEGQVVATVATDAQGDYLFVPVAPGTYSVHVSQQARSFGAISGVNVTALNLTNMGAITATTSSLSLTVLDSQTGQPVSGPVTLILAPLDLPAFTSRFAQALTGDSISMTGLAPGLYLALASDGTRPVAQLIVTLTAGANSANIQVAAGGTISGTVTDSGNGPIADLSVVAYDPAMPELRWNTFTDADGNYEIAIPAGNYRLILADVDDPDDDNPLPPTQLDAITVTLGQATDQDVQVLGGTSTIRGTVNGDSVDGVNTTPAAALVTLTNADGITVAFVSADRNGVFEFDQLPAGTYFIQVRAAGFHFAKTPAVALAGQETVVNPSGAWGTLAVGGVAEESAAPLHGFSFQTASLTPASNAAQELPSIAAQVKTAAIEIINKLLEPPKGDPRRIHNAPIDPDCPPAVREALRTALKWQQAADTMFSNWVERWETARRTALINAGLFGTKVVQFATEVAINVNPLGAALDAATDIKDAAQSAYRAAPAATEVSARLFDVFHTLTTQVNELKFVLQIGDYTELTTRIIDGAASGYELSLNGIGRVIDAFRKSRNWSDLADIADFADTVGGFVANVAQLGSAIATTAEQIGELLGQYKGNGLLEKVTDFIGIAAAALDAIAAAGQGINDGLGDIKSLNEYKGAYQNMLLRRDQAFSRFLNLLEQCEKDHEKDTDKPKRPRTRDDLRELFLVVSSDPNDIVGPAGSGAPDHFMRVDQNFPYVILFENKPEATAPAQEVVITQQLDADLDWSSFELGDFGFGNLIIDVPEGRDFYETRVDLTDTLGFFVDFSASINLTTGVATWRFVSIDPETGDLVDDALAGFLPPNDGTGRGQGFVEYSINPDANLTTGATITAQASIVFDDNAPLLTPTYINKIDSGVPTSSVNALPAIQDFSSFTVSWSGVDDAAGPTGSGVVRYDVYVSDDGGEFLPFLLGTSQTSAPFTGQVNHTYRFYSVATDGVGLIQPTPASGQAATQVLDVPFDLGDAPDPFVSTFGQYPTLFVNDGPRHRLGSGLVLGSLADREFDGQPDATASGDDTNGTTDDEDGVVLPSVFIRGSTGSVAVTASQIGKLDAWIDFNRDGDWNDAGEQVATSLTLNAGSNTVTFPVPAAASVGTSFARFRLSSAGGLAPTGLANDGEVEDYQVQLAVPLILNFGGPVTWTKKDPPVTVLTSVFVPFSNLTNGVLTLSVNAVGTSKKVLDQFTIPATSGLGTTAGPHFANGQLTLQIQLNGSVSSSSIQAFLQGITFSTKGKGLKQATRTVQVTLANSGGASSTITQTINVHKKAVSGAAVPHGKGGRHA